MQNKVWRVSYQQSTRHCGLAACCLRLAAFFVTFYFSFFTTTVHAQKSNEAVKQGNEAYRKNDFITAIKNYTKALQTDDKNAAAKFNLANAQQKSNNAEAAAENYSDVISKTTDAALQSKAYYNKGLAMLEQKKLDAAIDAFKQSLRLAPTDNDTRDNLQKALSEKKVPPPKQQPQPNENQKKEPDEKKQQPKMDKKMMEQKFKMLQEQEKQLQNTIQKQKINTREQEKDW